MTTTHTTEYTPPGQQGNGNSSDSIISHLTSMVRAVTDSTDTANGNITHDQIERRAYEIYRRRGRQDGECQENWRQAERELSEEAAMDDASLLSGVDKNDNRIHGGALERSSASATPSAKLNVAIPAGARPRKRKASRGTPA